jgi:Protein of unknown function (DUF2889)
MLLPPDPPLELLHHRDYEVRAFRKAPGELLIRGAIRDRRPGHQFLDEDPDPVTIHHMVVELVVANPSLEITDVNVVFEAHPHPSCPRIIDSYDQLVGLSIARGFTNNVRSLFGGPRGCTHTTALLQAMAPVAVQCVLTSRPTTSTPGEPVTLRAALSPEERKARFAVMINTCHVWQADGELVDKINRGEEHPIPLPIQQRRQDRAAQEAESNPQGDHSR